MASGRASVDILYVMKNGELREGETLNQIWLEQKPYSPFFWQVER